MKALLKLFLIFGGVLCLCGIYPDEIEKGVKATFSVLPWLFLAVFALGHVLAFIVALLAPSNPPAGHHSSCPPSDTPPVPPPARQSDTLTPLLLGLLVGWWLSRGPDDPST